MSLTLVKIANLSLDAVFSALQLTIDTNDSQTQQQPVNSTAHDEETYICRPACIALEPFLGMFTNCEGELKLRLNEILNMRGLIASKSVDTFSPHGVTQYITVAEDSILTIGVLA